MPAGTACRARAGCRPRPAPQVPHALHRWPSRRCRRPAPPPASRPPAPAPVAPIAPVQQAGGAPGAGHFAQLGRGCRAAAAAAGARQPADQPRIVLRASADAWVQVRDRAGAGAAEPHPACRARPGRCRPRPNLLLTTGNAGGTDLVVDGVTQPVARRQRRGAARPAAGPRPDQGRQAGRRSRPVRGQPAAVPITQ